jgi:hypothetical protein
VALAMDPDQASPPDDDQPTDYADPQVVRALAAEPPGDNGARNALITRSYFEIGKRLRQRLGSRNADWATTAAWASGAVGLIIRKQEATQSGFLRLAERTTGSLYDRLLADVRANLEEGNRQVYSELGVAFAELAAMCCGPDPWTDEDERAFLRDRLPPSISRSVPVRWQPRTDLAPPFRCYLEAMRLDDADPEQRKLKSELIFAANVLATVSEQAGLQPYLNAAFEGVARTLSSHWWQRLPFVRGGVQVVAYSAQALTQRMVTEWCIKVLVGDEALKVGRRIEPCNGHLWAPDLATLTDRRAQEVWELYSRAGDDGRGSAAADWTLMEDRMNYITCFFRSRQQDDRLLALPDYGRVT